MSPEQNPECLRSFIDALTPARAGMVLLPALQAAADLKGDKARRVSQVTELRREHTGTAPRMAV